MGDLPISHTLHVGGANAVVDAPGALLDYYSQHLAVEREKRYALAAAHEQARREREAAEEAARPTPGKVVKVVRGRKVPQGTEHVVFWYGQSDYGYHPTYRVGLESVETGERVYTAATNVEVIQEVS